jgi:hypothetical protein
MRSLAASIIIFSACATFIAAALVQHSGTNLFLNGVGLVVGAVGLIGWFTASGATSPKE